MWNRIKRIVTSINDVHVILFLTVVAFSGCVYQEATLPPRHAGNAIQQANVDPLEANKAQAIANKTIKVCLNGIQYYYSDITGIGGAVIDRNTKTYVECQ